MTDSSPSTGGTILVLYIDIYVFSILQRMQFRVEHHKYDFVYQSQLTTILFLLLLIVVVIIVVVFIFNRTGSN